MNNNLILRTLQSPYNDTTRGNILSQSDVDNNFIYLKGLSIYSATTNNGVITLNQLNGGTFSFSIGGTGVLWTAGTGTYSIQAINPSNPSANGLYSYAEGYNTFAGDYSHAEGYKTTAILYSHSGGSGSTSNGTASFVHGINSLATGTGTVVLGNNLTGTTDNTVYVNSLNSTNITANTVTTTNIKATSGQDLIFNVNNLESGRLNSTNNNTYLGYNISGGTGSTYSTLIGSNIFNNSNNNIGIGSNIFTTNTTGGRNVAIGYANLSQGATGTDNIAIGYNAAYKNNASANIAIGSSVLYNNVSGGENVGIGYVAMQYTTGGQNVGIGYAALQNTSSGSYNVAVGSNFAPVNVTGSYNTYLGSFADSYSGLTALTNSTAVGYNSKVTGSNIIQLGNSNISGVTTSGDLNLNNTNKTIRLHKGSTNDMFGDLTLTAGTAAITITGLTSNDRAFTQLTSPSGIVGGIYKAVCTTNSLTITSLNTNGTTLTTDTSTLSYFIVRPSF